MSREWKPGDVAMVTPKFASKRGEARAFRFNPTRPGWKMFGGAFWADDEVADARPLVVIDPEDRQEVERLLERLVMGEFWRTIPSGRVAVDHRCDQLQAVLREFADPTPPKPDEPTGLGAVVEAINDNRFVRVGDAGWVHEENVTGEPCDWQDIAAVRVLSEGVTA